jgi:hypothetical protein
MVPENVLIWASLRPKRSYNKMALEPNCSDGDK